MSTEELYERLKKAIADGDEETAAETAKLLKEAGVSPIDVVNNAIKPIMDEIGEKYEKLEIFLPELVLAGDAATAALNVIFPKGEESEVVKGTVVIGTIYGDIHEIGKSIVAAMLRANGYKVVDLGCDVPPTRFVEEAKKHGAKIIGISCLLSPSMFYMRDVIKRLEDEGIRGNYYVIVGGASVSPDWAKEIKADGWAKDAERTVKLCNMLLEKGGELEKPVILGEWKLTEVS